MVSTGIFNLGDQSTLLSVKEEDLAVGTNRDKVVTVRREGNAMDEASVKTLQKRLELEWSAVVEDNRLVVRSSCSAVGTLLPDRN